MGVAFTIFCSWCNEHKFMIDRETLDEFNFAVLTCPKCKKQTTVGTNQDTPLIILPGTPNSTKKDASDKTGS